MLFFQNVLSLVSTASAAVLQPLQLINSQSLDPYEVAPGSEGILASNVIT